jgi:hypothetical protein
MVLAQHVLHGSPTTLIFGGYLFVDDLKAAHFYTHLLLIVMMFRTRRYAGRHVDMVYTNPSSVTGGRSRSIIGQTVCLELGGKRGRGWVSQ